MTSLCSLLQSNHSKFGNNYENFLTLKSGFPVLNAKNTWVLVPNFNAYFHWRADYLNFLAEKIVKEGPEIAKLPNIQKLITQFNITWLEARLKHQVKYEPDVKEILFNSKIPKYEWLSNFFQTLIYSEKPIAGIFPRVESAYKAYKDFLVNKDKQSVQKIANMTDVIKLKKLKADVPKSKTLPLMRQLIYLKFNQNPILQNKLVATAPASLIEQTDNMFWGQGPSHTVEKGENKLGKILMDERAFIIKEIRKTISSPTEKI